MVVVEETQSYKLEGCYIILLLLILDITVRFFFSFGCTGSLLQCVGSVLPGTGASLVVASMGSVVPCCVGSEFPDQGSNLHPLH